MVSLQILRTERGWTLDKMCKELGISIATLSRIEAAERGGWKQPLDGKVARPLVTKINGLFSLSCTIDDLSIVVAPPRPGKPKKVREVQA